MQGDKKSRRRRLFRESLTATTNHKSIYSVEFSKKAKVLKSSSIINAFTSMKPNSDPPPWRWKKGTSKDTPLFDTTYIVGKRSKQKRANLWDNAPN